MTGVPRRRGALIVLLVALAAVVTTGAAATEHERITVDEGEIVEREYPPIPGNDPASNEVETPTPEYCRTASVACDVIPITIEPPSEPGTEYFVRITVDWEAEPDPTGATSAATNDLDLYFWNDPPGEMTATSTPDDPDTEEDESEEVNPGASGRLPEVINWFSTEPGDFLLLVKNYLGQNTGYTLTLRYFTPDAAPSTGFAGVTDPAPAPESSSPPASPPRRSRPASPTPTMTDTTSPAVAAQPLTEDPDFEGFGSLDIEDELAAPSDVAQLRPASRATSVPEEPSGASLLVWLVLVPLGGLGGIVVWLLRRRPGVLRIS